MPDLPHRYWRPLGWLVLLAWISLQAGTVSAFQERSLVRHQPPTGSGDLRDDYAIGLLHLALARTEHDFGPADVHEIGIRMSQDRTVREMRVGRYVDVFWATTSHTREAKLEPVRIPLTRGLQGVRVPVVNKDAQHIPDVIDDVEALRNFTIAQGHDWPDAGILEHNGLQVMRVPSYDSLFRMLEADRYDLFLRGIIELQAEAAMYDQHGLVPRSGTVIAYYAPNYFFVAPDNHALAFRIEIGLRRALADGSFHLFMHTHPATRTGIELLLRDQHTLIALHNPHLPYRTPTWDRELWFEPVFDQLPDPEAQ